MKCEGGICKYWADLLPAGILHVISFLLSSSEDSISWNSRSSSIIKKISSKGLEKWKSHATTHSKWTGTWCWHQRDRQVHQSWAPWFMWKEWHKEHGLESSGRERNYVWNYVFFSVQLCVDPWTVLCQADLQMYLFWGGKGMFWCFYVRKIVPVDMA